MNLQGQRQLAADRTWVAATSGDLRFQMHRPTPQERLEGLAGDGACDSYRYPTVFEDNGTYRLYYALVQRAEPGAPRHLPDRIVYAESQDGIHWHHPRLGLYEVEGCSATSIVWMEKEGAQFGVRGFSPFRDENPDAAPARRYKAVAQVGPVGAKKFGGNGLAAMCSPDGIHWSMDSDTLIMSGSPGLGGYDSQNLAFWDAVRGEYRLYWRVVYAEGPLGVFRDILTATSPDFRNWSPPERLRYPGSEPEQLNTNNIRPYYRATHLVLGFTVRYVHLPWSEAITALPESERRQELIRHFKSITHDKDPTGASGERIGTGLTDALFMLSRDGLHFHRWPGAFIRPGLRLRDNWFYGDNFPAWGMLPTPTGADGQTELSFYITEGERQPGVMNRLRRHSLRVDGFVSATALDGGLWSVAFPWSHGGTPRLEINFAASAAGSVRVELQDETGWPLPGFEMENQIELLGDATARLAVWKGAPTLPPAEGRKVRLRFHLREAELYAFLMS